MKSQDTIMNEYILRYLQDRGESITLAEIATRPRWRRVWFYWLALEKYEGKPMPNTDIETCKRIYGD